uniref:tRNA (guanine(9)-N(1))-methyltransferase n=1 Tax=Prasinoderma coloniale TaxID=156133 RepID=A0A7R9TUM7_9VIRI|eukprot:PRCOL_00000725-RA
MADAAALAATGAATAAPLPPGSPSDAPLSKRQKRRLANAARRAETKKARRAAEKEKKRLNTAARKEERAEELRGLGEEERQEVIRRRKEERLERVRAKQEQERRLSEAVTRGVRLAIDMRWADQQTDREMRSLSFQLSQAYASNRLSPDPCCIVLAGLSEASHAAIRQVNAGLDNWRATVIEHAALAELYAERRADVVYLSADADEELTEIERDKVYVVGGMLDHNSRKGATQECADAEGWRTARLPLARHVELGGSPVLTVNQVVDMLLLQLAGVHAGLEGDRAWKMAIEMAVPQRKRKGYVKGEGEGPPTGGAGAAAYAAIKAAATARQVETQREGVREEAQAAVGGDMGRAADGSDA